MWKTHGQLAIELILDDGDHDHDDIRFEVGRLREKTTIKLIDGNAVPS